MIVSQFYCDLCHQQMFPDLGWERGPVVAQLVVQYLIGNARNIVREHVCQDCVARLIVAMQPLPKPEVPPNA